MCSKGEWKGTERGTAAVSIVCQVRKEGGGRGVYRELFSCLPGFLHCVCDRELETACLVSSELHSDFLDSKSFKTLVFHDVKTGRWLLRLDVVITTL